MYDVLSFMTSTIHPRWDKTLSYIKQKWHKEGFKIKTYKFNRFEEAIETFPRQGGKNDIHIGLLSWDERDVDVVFVTKHRSYLEYPLQKRFNQMTEKELHRMGLFPPDSACPTCNEITAWTAYTGECYDCVQ